jgi:hypothetical protein
MTEEEEERESDFHRNRAYVIIEEKERQLDDHGRDVKPRV